MRNLKRALSLVMAMALIVGMMVVSASAVSKDFTDAGEIDHTEAVDVLVTLNVISGKEDGSYFDPAGTLTRAEMAKIVAYVMNGGVEPNIGTKVIPTYSDIDNTWAEKYIEYCTSMGIIAGDGQGKFNPLGTLTASQTAKMFLTAMGYNASVFGLVGANWESNTNRYANEAGLYESLGDVAVNEPISRDDAAQMAYNAIRATMMKRTWALDTTTGQLTETYQPWYDDDTGVSVPHTLLGEKFGVVEVEGVVTANEFATIGADGASMVDGRTRLSNISNSTRHSYDNSGAKIFLVSTGEEYLGRTVTMYVKVDTNATSDSTKAVVIGEPIISDKNTVVSTTAGYGTGKDLDDFAASNSLVYSIGSDTAIFSYNYGAANGVGQSYTGAGRGITTTLVDNDSDGQYDYAFVVDPSFGEVTSKTTTGDGNIRISGLPKTDYVARDIVGFDDVARGDYVNYIEVGGVLYVSKADYVVGEMTQYDKSKHSYFLVDGTQYGTSQITTKSIGIIEPLTDTDTASADGYLNKESVFYLDTLGNVVAVGKAEASSQYAFVSAVDTSTIDGSTLETANRAKATLSATGDTLVKTVYGIDGVNGTLDGTVTGAEVGAPATVNTLYTYTVNGDDEFVFTYIDDTDDIEINNVAVKMTKGETTIMVGGTKYFADDETAFIYIAPDGTYNAASDSIGTGTSALGTTGHPAIDSVSAYTGYQNAYSFDGTTDCLLVLGTGDEANIVKAIVIVAESAGLADDLVYLYDYVGTNNYGEVYNVIMNGEVVENVTITSGAAGAASEGTVAKYSATEHGYSIVALTSNVTSGNITVKGANSIVVKGNEYTLTADTVIANIDGDDTTVTDVTLVKGDYVTVVYEPDDSIKAVYVTVPYAANNAAIHEVNITTKVTGATELATVATGAAGGWNVTLATGATAADLVAALDVSYDADSVAVYSGFDGEDVTGSAFSGALSTGTYYVAVVSQDTTNTAVYQFTVA